MKHLPNWLSGARLALAPYVCYLLYTREYGSALWWFGAAAVSDGLDGWLARRWHAESRLGAMLDPLADKVLLSGAFAALALAGAIPWWLAAVVLGRDALILLAAAALLAWGAKQRAFPPTIWGKLSTAAQIACILAVVITGGPVTALTYVVAILALLSGLGYARRAF